MRVLALYVATPGAAGAASFETVFQKTMGEALGSRLDFQSEFIDLSRYSDPSYPAALVDFLHYKYERLPPDVIIATTEGAHQFVERFRAQLFPATPVVFIDRTASPRVSPGMTGITAPLDLAGTVDLALTLQPATTQVFVVSGKSEFDRRYQEVARQQLARFAGRVGVTYLSGPSLADLSQTLAHLPSDAIIYFLTFGEDGVGARFRSTEVVDRLAGLANRPIYSWHSVGMDHGIVGGRLYSNEVVGGQAAQVALRILRGERPESIPVLAVDPSRTELDWRQLRRWGISQARVPAGATILFRNPTLWDRYRVYIAAALALMLVQTALIAGLLLQSARRRRTEAALFENHATLEASNRQISDLFGRLIAAQETERRRIARDLHDDVSQRIAGLSIMISSLKARFKSEPADGDAVQVLASMHQHTSELADEIRHLSHELHPGLLQHAGLVTALQVSCAQFEKAHATTVTYAAGDGIEPIDADSALCLYRITQEALRNVVKHASARQVEVVLTRTSSDDVELSIADDGSGFDLLGARARAGGLGLVSIDERVRLLGGHVRIETHPHGGTRVRVRIPRIA